MGLSLAGGLALTSGMLVGCATSSNCAKSDAKTCGAKKFKMKFAPRGLFRASCGKDPFKRFKWLSENGFWAVEGVVFVNPDKIYRQEEMNLQRALGAYAKEVGLEMGCVSSMNNKDFPVMTANQVPLKDRVIRDKKALRQHLANQMDNTFGVMERLGSRQFIIGAGTVDKELSPEKQYENTVENMAFCADYCKRYGFTMEIEPLNTTSHPDLYIDRAALGAKIVRDVNNPHCRLLFGAFHRVKLTGCGKHRLIGRVVGRDGRLLDGPLSDLIDKAQADTGNQRDRKQNKGILHKSSFTCRHVFCLLSQMLWEASPSRSAEPGCCRK